MNPKRCAILAFTAFVGAACTQTSAVAAKHLPAPKADLKGQKAPATAVFAAGCFWCVEAVFERLDGVQKVVSGYAGDSKANADYKKVSYGKTKHAETVQITYDPAKISYGQLLQVLFSLHDPTTLNAQGPDHGTQYRSAIFYATPDEKKVAEQYIATLDGPEYFGGKIVTSLEPLTEFYPAEDYHQDFVRLHPDHGYVRAWALPKVAKVEKLFPQLIAKQ